MSTIGPSNDHEARFHAQVDFCGFRRHEADDPEGNHRHFHE
jgi:hypothetical protein